jgi:hypothetical protein
MKKKIIVEISPANATACSWLGWTDDCAMEDDRRGSYCLAFGARLKRERGKTSRLAECVKAELLLPESPAAAKARL